MRGEKVASYCSRIKLKMTDTNPLSTCTVVLVLIVSFTATIYYPSAVNGQPTQVGVYLRLLGEVISNNSLVNINDILQTWSHSVAPSNARPDLHDQALLCITDLVDCCESPLRGNWYYPNGSVVKFDAGGVYTFMANRGQNEAINGRQFYGSVRLYRHWWTSETGYFRCELPSAADPIATQILYANIVDFGGYYPVTLSSSGPATGGEVYSLTCSATLLDPVPLSSNAPSPTFEWFFGPSGNATLPSGVIPMETTSSSSSTSITYTSTLQFPPLTESHTGKYTCKLGAGRLASSANIAVNGTHVYLALNGTVYPNNSVIPITEIGGTYYTILWSTHNTGLQCITDRIPCCYSRNYYRAGEWYFPDRTTTVPPFSIATTFYRNRGDDGTVNLNRLNTNVMSPTGLFCCVVPDSTNILQRICANIVPYKSIVIITSAISTPTVGETYSLNCSVNTTDPPTYQWFKEEASNRLQYSNVSQLHFSPLRASDAGLYTCLATVRDMVMKETTTMTVKLPAPTTVTLTPTFTFAGSSRNLVCTVEFHPLVDIPVNVNTIWTGPAGFMMTNTAQPVMESTNIYISTTTVGRHQSGNYTCNVTAAIMSSFFTESVGYASSKITVIPEPNVSLHSDSPNPVLSGSTLSLICTAELHSMLHVPLFVTTTLKGPEGTIVNNTLAVATDSEMKSFVLYTSSHSLPFLQSTDSGEYTCTMNFGNGLEVSANTNITIVDRSVDICQKWHSKDSESEQCRNFIKVALIKAIERNCKCYFPIINLLSEDAFICEDSSNLVTYRNTLLGMRNLNNTQIIDFIQELVSTAPLIKISRNYVQVDSSCPVALSLMDTESFCGQNEKEHLTICDNDPKLSMCAENLINEIITNCFAGCVVHKYG